MIRIALQPDFGRDPILLTVVKMGDPLDCRYNGSPHKIRTDLKHVAHVVGKTCEVALARTSHGALAVADWYTSHNIEAGIVFDKTMHWYGVVVSEDDLLVALALLDSKVVNPITGAITPKITPRRRPTHRNRANLAELLH